MGDLTVVKKSKVRNKSVTAQRRKVPGVNRWGEAYTVSHVRQRKGR